MSDPNRTGIDRSLPYTPVIMERADAKGAPVYPLAAGYRFVTYAPGDEERWADLQLSVDHVDSRQEALDLFRKEFLMDDQPDTGAAIPQCPGYEKTRKRTVLIESAAGQLVAAGTLWTGITFGDVRERVHWIAVHPDHQGQGLAKALMHRLMTLYDALGCTASMYLTTQTWSYRAVGIYEKFGFTRYLGDKPVNWAFKSDLQLGDYHAELRAAWALIDEKRAAYRK